TFSKLTPITSLRKLATETEKQFLKINNLDNSNTSQAKFNYYFYSYFKSNLDNAATNNQIKNLYKQQTIDKITSKPINTNTLAHIITYFYILILNKPSMSTIRKAYTKQFYPEAKQILFAKF
ncbi:17252_t:CDS:1, partial [Racocetra fulgida]